MLGNAQKYNPPLPHMKKRFILYNFFMNNVIEIDDYCRKILCGCGERKEIILCMR